VCYLQRIVQANIGRFHGDRSCFRPKNCGGVPILVEEAHKGICDDEEEEGGRGHPARLQSRV
jgi:hypothetical protein